MVTFNTTNEFSFLKTTLSVSITRYLTTNKDMQWQSGGIESKLKRFYIEIYGTITDFLLLR